MSPAIDPRTPVVVGIGVAHQRNEDPAAARDAIALMIDATWRAGIDSGAADSTALLRAAELVSVPKGMWLYTDPARNVAHAIGAASARTALVDLGVLQPSLFRHACSAILNGEVEVAVVVGGEAKYRSLRAAIAGFELVDTESDGPGPDEFIRPSADILHPIEIARGLPVPARQYAIIDSALRHAQGLTIVQHADALADLWSSFSAVAQNNPDAWNREFASPETLHGTATNPMFAFPYTKLHCSQWNVDQAAAFVVCSYERAVALGCDQTKFVFPRAIVESNFMAPVVERAEIHRSPAVGIVGSTLAEAIDRPLDSVEYLDLYSCFPAAVRVQIEEFGITPSAHEALTVTGGMTFGGGPLNNYTFQSLAKLCERLRRAPDAIAVGSAVSGMLTKFGAWAWSCTPSADGVRFADVTSAVAAATALVGVDPTYVGDARVAGYTIAYDKGVALQTIAIVDTPTGARSIASSTDPAIHAEFSDNEWIGRLVRVDGDVLRRSA